MTQYEDISFLNIDKNIKLTKDTSTGRIYVKKYLKNQSQYEIYSYLRQKIFSVFRKLWISTLKTDVMFSLKNT